MHRWGSILMREKIKYKKQTTIRFTKLKAAVSAGLVSGTLLAFSGVVNADTNWTANSPQQIANQITNTQQMYTIRAGDTLWGISTALKTKGTSISVAQLAALNHIPNENLIYTGNSLKFAGKTIMLPQQSVAPTTNQTDKSALEAKLKVANEYLYTNGIYTEQSLDNLRNAVYRGNGVIKAANPTQQDVDAAIAKIEQGINNLQKIQ
ncbi:LysM peptidoglycan-binding domain-containing protein [Liquorilactobacillus satsumensis]|nr:LysM peptidoglycan-binding domain-containing protein [Liquorilactobacillus satsumensis]MCP9313007.1 LysM peptidoglycan-binding domain-containing protein [Liquorilactobacillus satsumensis]MCP9357662.1 LysM peptidoglycan-binding domain-containing protein [Liquorilactobacillus satsumensis]MCP9360163.1 LysM peptidoglycan-binding domain-containing protein [Liquorilactobacillus satsumensis]MCP9371402.1 LysM peptidoglycan-binding domain-containing protein [Liquorilactobacillus satsumensis]